MTLCCGSYAEHSVNSNTFKVAKRKHGEELLILQHYCNFVEKANVSDHGQSSA